jgi:hypothetical protein
VTGGELELRGAGTDLTTWAEEARLVHQIAVQLANTSFVPRSLQGRADEVTGAILSGRELGLEPMAALRSIDIIDGTPALRAVALRGLVQAAGHEVWVEQSTETRAVVNGRRKGSANVQASTWTMDRARKAGLAGKKNWTTQPQSMLVARATAEVCRLIAADVLLALPFVAEEVSDDFTPDVAPAKVQAITSAKKTTAMKRKPLLEAREERAAQVAPFAEPRPVAVEGPSLDDVPAEPADGITDGMRRALHAAYRELGITDRTDRLAHASAVLGRQVGSVNDLSYAEGHDLLAALEVEVARREPLPDEGADDE